MHMFAISYADVRRDGRFIGVGFFLGFKECEIPMVTCHVFSISDFRDWAGVSAGKSYIQLSTRT
jgi:hypothetical protein